VLAEWAAKQINGRGRVFVDRGLAGAPISAQLANGFRNVLKKYPGIEVIGNYNGQYALGPEQEGVASLLGAHPDVDAILTQGYGTGAMNALQDAGKKAVPITAFSYNGTATACGREFKIRDALIDGEREFSGPFEDDDWKVVLTAFAQLKLVPLSRRKDDDR
jgi:ribose transport system substrate-binding protein